MFASNRSIAAWLVIALSLLTATSAIAPPDTVAFKFEKRLTARSRDASPLLHKRQAGTVSVEISNFELLYLINVTIGTPPQEFSLQLDTGSSDLWIPSSDSDICTYDTSYYCTYGKFDYNASTTFKLDSSFGNFYIAYVDGTEILGTYFNDTLNVGGTDMKGVTMAVATSASRDLGIMGIGFTENESSNSARRPQLGLGPTFTYPSVVDNLVSQGHIKSRSYALWLDDLNDDRGTILFGGVDSSKYSGSLVVLPIQDDERSGSKTSFTVAWTDFTVTVGTQALPFSPSSAQPIILDSGTTLTYLPDDIVESILKGLGATTDPNVGNVVPCDIIANNITFTYTFGGSDGARISVPLSELLLPITNEDGTPYTGTRNSGDPQLCVFGIEKAGSSPLLFGDTFLRSAYVVYDLDNFEIALAQTNFRASVAGSSNVQTISGSGSIPDVSRTASAVTVEQTYTGIPLNTEGGGRTTAKGTGMGTGTVSRSATFTLSTTGTVPPSAMATSGSGSGSSASRTSSSKTSTGTTAGASATNAAGRAGFGGSSEATVLLQLVLGAAAAIGSIRLFWR